MAARNQRCLRPLQVFIPLLGKSVPISVDHGSITEMCKAVIQFLERIVLRNRHERAAPRVKQY
jgi:hypothetical protein